MSSTINSFNHIISVWTTGQSHLSFHLRAIWVINRFTFHVDVSLFSFSSEKNKNNTLVISNNWTNTCPIHDVIFMVFFLFTFSRYVTILHHSHFPPFYFALASFLWSLECFLPQLKHTSTCTQTVLMKRISSDAQSEKNIRNSSAVRRTCCL